MTTIASADDIRLSLQSLTPPDDAWLDYLVDLYPRFNEIAVARLHLGWRPVGGEVLKFRNSLDRKRLRHFADYVYGGIGFEMVNDFLETRPAQPDESPRIVRNAQNVEKAHERILHLIKEEAEWAASKFADLAFHWAALIGESADIGGVFRTLEIAKHKARVSHQSVRVSWRAPMMVNWLGHAPTSVLEIGGGHGKFTRDCALLLPDAHLFLVDLPFNLIVQARYLREYFGDSVNLCLMDDQRVDPGARVNLVAPWRMDEIPAPIDIAANFLSFQHMDATNLDWYGAAFRTLGVRHLFHQNRLTQRDPFDFGADDYPFRSDFRLVERLESLYGKLYFTNGTSQEITVVTELFAGD